MEIWKADVALVIMYRTKILERATQKEAANKLFHQMDSTPTPRRRLAAAEIYHLPAKRPDGYTDLEWELHIAAVTQYHCKLRDRPYDVRTFIDMELSESPHRLPDDSLYLLPDPRPEWYNDRQWEDLKLKVAGATYGITHTICSARWETGSDHDNYGQYFYNYGAIYDC
jgi:hypothetical protein